MTSLAIGATINPVYYMKMHYSLTPLFPFFFFFNDTATTEIYTLSLHDALPISDEILGNRDRFVRCHRFDRQAGGHIAEQRQLDRAASRARRHHFDRSASIPRPLDEAFLLKVRQMLVHCGERRETEAAADFFEAGRVPVLGDELVQVVENLALAF